jgi:hypothetical protein
MGISGNGKLKIGLVIAGLLLFLVLISVGILALGKFAGVAVFFLVCFAEGFNLIRAIRTKKIVAESTDVDLKKNPTTFYIALIIHLILFLILLSVFLYYTGLILNRAF